eukprot:gene32906-39795_t
MTWPSCIYEYTNIVEKGSLVKVVSIEQDLFTSSLKVSAQCINVYLKSRVSSVLKAIKSFPVHVYTDIAVIVRYVFRQILTLFPFMSEISIWMVDITKRVVSSHHALNSNLVPKLDFTTLTSATTKEEQVANANESASLFSKLFGASSKKPKGLPPTVPKPNGDLSRVSSIHEADGVLASKLTCGSFGLPARILSAPNERNLYSGVASGTIVETLWAIAPVELEVGMSMHQSSRSVLEHLYAELLTHIKQRIDPKDQGKGEASSKKKMDLSCYRVLSGHTLYPLASSKSNRIGDTAMPVQEEKSSVGVAYSPKKVHSVLCELFQVAKQSSPRVDSPAPGIAAAPSGILRNLSRNISFGNTESAAPSPALSRANSNTDAQPTGRTGRNSIVTNHSALSRDTSRAMSFVTAPPPPAGTNPANLHFFLSLKTSGLGGEKGFGILGSESEGMLKDIVTALEAALMKYHTVIYGSQTAAAPPENTPSATLHPPSLSLPNASDSATSSPPMSSSSTPVGTPIVTSRAEKRSSTGRSGNEGLLLKASLTRPKSRVSTPDQT